MAKQPKFFYCNFVKWAGIYFQYTVIELCLAYLMGAKSDGQMTENYYIFFNVLVFIITKRKTPWNLKICTAHHAEYFRNSQRKLQKYPSCRKRTDGTPESLLETNLLFQQNQLQLCHPDRCLPNMTEVPWVLK